MFCIVIHHQLFYHRAAPYEREANHLFTLPLSFILLCFCFFFELFKSKKNIPKTSGGYEKLLPLTGCSTEHRIAPIFVKELQEILPSSVWALNPTTEELGNTCFMVICVTNFSYIVYVVKVTNYHCT